RRAALCALPLHAALPIEKCELAEEASAVLRDVCERIGVDATGARLIRLRSNAVFKLREDLVVRITTAPDALTRLPTVLAVARWLDRKSTRLNSSHVKISY